jgi:hypothetical protein
VPAPRQFRRCPDCGHRHPRPGQQFLLPAAYPPEYVFYCLSDCHASYNVSAPNLDDYYDEEDDEGDIEPSVVRPPPRPPRYNIRFIGLGSSANVIRTPRIWYLGEEDYPVPRRRRANT